MEGLIDELRLLRDSLAANRGEAIADGLLRRIGRLVRTFGFHVATLDVRENAEAHHKMLGELFDQLGELERPYGDLERSERSAVLLGRVEQRPASRSVAFRSFATRRDDLCDFRVGSRRARPFR